MQHISAKIDNKQTVTYNIYNYAGIISSTLSIKHYASIMGRFHNFAMYLPKWLSLNLVLDFLSCEVDNSTGLSMCHMHRKDWKTLIKKVIDQPGYSKYTLIK